MIKKGLKICSIICCLVSVCCFTLGQNVFAKENVVWEKNMDLCFCHFTDITFGKGKYIVIGLEGVIRTSLDSINWTNRTSGVNNNLNSIACNEELFVVGGFKGTILTSTDGTKWNRIKLGNQEEKYTINKILWDGKQFVAVGAKNINGIIMTSTDGITWTTRLSDNVAAFNSIVYNGYTYVAVGYGGAIYTSSDTISWTKVVSGLNSNINDIATNSEKFVAVNYKGEIITSEDGANWSKISIADSSFNNIIWDGTQFVTSCQKGVFFTSIDGLTWIKNLVDENITFFNFTYHEGQYIAPYANKIMTSQNLLNWTINTSFGIKDNLLSIAYNDKLFVIGASSGKTLTSNDGSAWTLDKPFTYDIIEIIWDGKRFVGITFDRTIIVSPDGVNWTLSDSTQPLGLSKITFNDEFLIAVNGSNSTFRSYDGLKWEALGSIIKDKGVNLNDIFWDGKCFVAVGSKSYDLEDITSTNKKGLFATSKDGLEWTYKIFEHITEFSSIDYNGKKHITSEDNIFELTDDKLLKSIKSINRKNFTSLVCYNDLFLGTSNISGINLLFTSEDGINWTAVSESYDSHIYQIAFYANKFFAVGPAGTLITGKTELKEYLAGDVNDDKKVNSIDFALLRSYLLGKTYDINMNNADINKDGNVNALDFALLRRSLLGYS